jgi:hypothetical protein
MTEQARTITLDGISYDVDQFTDAVKQAVGIYNSFAADLQKEQVAVVKTQSAMQSLGAQIAAAVRKELDDKKAAAEAAANGETPAEVVPAAE